MSANVRARRECGGPDSVSSQKEPTMKIKTKVRAGRLCGGDLPDI
jgi:hypothetical protein